MDEILHPESPPEASAPPSAPVERETFAAYIQIVGPVFYNQNISDKGKLLYGLLAAMTQPPRYYAFARNRTMLKFLDCSERTLQRCLSELEKAGELTIEDGAGGKSLRKIRLSRLQPVYPVTDDGGTPAKNDGGNKNNRVRSNRSKKRGNAPSVSQEEIIQWFNVWVAKQDLSQDDSVALCTDIRDFAENRESAGKPFKTIQAAVRMGNRLIALSKDDAHPVAMMRYLLSKSIRNNWVDVFALNERDLEDYRRFLASEYGISGEDDPADEPEYF